jgi:hypothetical protein
MGLRGFATHVAPTITTVLHCTNQALGIKTKVEDRIAGYALTLLSLERTLP